MPLEFYLGEIRGRHSFFLIGSAPVHRIGRGLLEAYEVHISVTPKGEMFLDLKNQSDFLYHIMFVTHDEDDAEQDKLLCLLPKELWALNSTDIGRIHSASPTNISIDKNKPLPNIHQYLLRQEAIEGIKPLISAYIEKDLIVPCTSPCNTPILLVKKSNGKG